MAEQHLEVVRAAYARFEQGDMRAGVNMFHPDVVFESFMPDSNERVVFHGVSGVAEFMREFLSSWRDYRIHADRFVAGSDGKVLVEGRQSAVGRGSGVQVESSTHSIWTFRDDRVVHLIWELDLAKAREAAGVAE